MTTALTRYRHGFINRIEARLYLLSQGIPLIEQTERQFYGDYFDTAVNSLNNPNPKLYNAWMITIYHPPVWSDYAVTDAVTRVYGNMKKLNGLYHIA
jgi:hypothetical protein